MDDKLKEILNQTNITGLTDLPLFESQESSSFGEFLKEQRIKPFVQLHILEKFLDEEFTVVFKEKIFSRERFEDGVSAIEKKSEGSVFVGEFSGAELFQFILQEFGFRQINPQSPANILLYNHSGEWSWELEGMILINKDLVLTPEEVFTNKPDLIEGIIKHHKDQFFELLQEADSVGVPHNTYIEWLKNWFPKHVHIRSLS